MCTPSPSGIGVASGAQVDAAVEDVPDRVEQRAASAVFGMKPCAPAPSAAITVAWSCVADSTTIGTPG